MNILLTIDSYIKLGQQRTYFLSSNYTEHPISSEERLFGIKPKTKEEQLEELKSQMEEIYSNYRITCQHASLEDLTVASTRINKIVEDLNAKLTSLVQRKEWSEKRGEEQSAAGITISANKFEESAIELERNVKDTKLMLAFYEHFQGDLSSRIEKMTTKKANL